MSNRLVSLVLVALVCLVTVMSRQRAEGFSTGAPEESCANMSPRHDDLQPQETPSPYEVKVSKVGSQFYVTLNDASGVTPFKGFFVQARDIATFSLMGQFYDTTADEAQLVSCLVANNSVTQTNNTPKQSVQFKWNALGASLSGVYIVATFVKDYSTFWSNVLSVELASLVDDACLSVDLVTREEWNARPPTSISYLNPPVNMTFVHHTAGTPCFDETTCIRVVRAMQDYHIDVNGWADIGYSFLVGEDGRVYEGRGWNVIGAHTFGYNDVAFGFSVMGNFMESLPNDLAQTALKNIIACGVQLGYITEDYEMFGHRDGRCTLCPGDLLYDEIRTWPHYSFRQIPIFC